MTTSENSADPILRLALRIARRADEISLRTSRAYDDLKPWLRAEQEILGLRLPVPALRTVERPHPLRVDTEASACSCS